MFITKTSLPRRTVLRGMGATLALPLLDAMVPALTPTALTAAAPTQALRRGVRADGRAAEPLDADRRPARLRVQPDPEAARDVPRLRRRWSRTSTGRCRARTRSAPARG